MEAMGVKGWISERGPTTLTTSHSDHRFSAKTSTPDPARGRQNKTKQRNPSKETRTTSPLHHGRDAPTMGTQKQTKKKPDPPEPGTRGVEVLPRGKLEIHALYGQGPGAHFENQHCYHHDTPCTPATSTIIPCPLPRKARGRPGGKGRE